MSNSSFMIGIVLCPVEMCRYELKLWFFTLFYTNISDVFPVYLLFAVVYGYASLQNTEWGCLQTGCWGGYFYLRGTGRWRKLGVCNVSYSSRSSVTLKMAGFCVVAPCSLVEVYRRFRGACCFHRQGDEYSENSHLHIRRRENLKFPIITMIIL
jgi:hypothetical protein